MRNIIKKFKKNYLIIFFLVNLTLLWTLYTFNDKLQYQAIKKITYKKADIKKQYLENIDSKYKDLDISFSLKIGPKDNIGDIIKTDTSKNAFVMKLAKPSSLQIIMGHNNPQGNIIFPLTDLYQYENLHRIKIKVVKEKQLWVLMDDALVINTYDKNINFKISKIQFGKNLNNAVSNVNIKYSIYNKSQLISIIKIILFLTFVWSCLQLIKNNFKYLTRKQKIEYTVFLLLTGFLMAIFYHLGQKFLGYSFPKNTFLFKPENMFGDFIEPVNSPEIITYTFFTTFIKQIFYLIGMETTLTLFIVSTIALLSIINIKEIGDNKLSTSSIVSVIFFTLLSYPVLFVINRANFEILVFLFLYLFAHYFSKKKFYASAMYLAFAISMKIFPAVFLVVFLSYKKFRTFLYACFLSLFLNIASFAVIIRTSTKSVNKIISDYLLDYTDNTGPYIKEYVIDNRGLEFGHTLYGLLKLRFFVYYKSTAITDVTLKKVTEIFNYYSKLQISIFAVLSAYIIFVEKELWKKIALLVIAMNLLPYVSADYKLVQFFIPLYLFINKKGISKLDLIYVILFSLLLVPKNYYTTLLNLPDTSLAIFLNPIFMIVLALLIMTDGLYRYYLKLKE